MTIHKLTTTDAFISFDLGDAPAAGITRRAPKVLQDGATLLARSTTYAFASFGIRKGGGSAGINAADDVRDEAVAAFVAEVRELVAAGRWTTDPGLGIDAADLAPLRDVDPRPAELLAHGGADLVVRGAFAAAAAVAGGLDGASVVVAARGPLAEHAAQAAAAVGATVSGDAMDAPGDVLFVAGKAGVLDHEVADAVAARVVVPLTPVPVTARAHAELTKADRIHVPDFLSTAAPLLAGHDPDGIDPVSHVGEVTAALAAHGPGLWLAAAQRAEEFLLSWNEALPFGRPLA